MLFNLLESIDFTQFPFGVMEWICIGGAGLALIIIIVVISLLCKGKGKKKVVAEPKQEITKNLEPMKVEAEEESKELVWDDSFNYETGKAIDSDEFDLIEDEDDFEEDTTEETVEEEVIEEKEAETVEEEQVEEIEGSNVLEIEGFDQEEISEEKEAETVEEEDVEEPTEEEPKVAESNVIEIEGFDDQEVVEEEQVEETTEEPAEATVEEEQVAETVEDEAVEEATEEATEEKTEETQSNRYKGKYDIFVEGDSYRFRLRASNGEALAISELYRSEKSARQGIETAKRNIETGKFTIVVDKHDLWRFILTSSTGRQLLSSASYKTEKRANTALQSFKRFAPSDTIVVVESTKAQVAVDVEAYDDGGNFESSANGKYMISLEDGKYYYILKASNGVKICHSQGYASKTSCSSALEKFRETVYNGTFYISKDKNNKFQFKLYINKPRRVVMSGEIYDSRDAAVKVIKSIKRFAKDAKLKD